MKKKIVISVTAVILALAVIGASVGVYMSYINKYEPIASPTALTYTKSESQKELVKNADFYVSVNGDDNGIGTLINRFKQFKEHSRLSVRLLQIPIKVNHQLPLQ